MDCVKDQWRLWRPDVLSGIAFFVLRLIGMTLRVKTKGAEKFENCGSLIFCGFHGRSFVFANYFRKRGYWVIISQSRDGELQNRVFSKLGFQVIRGSTGRGGVRAAVEAIRALKGGSIMAMTPDGPRGPSGVVQGGVMLMAHKSGAALVPVGISAYPRYLARSWDRYLVPFPFARAAVIFGDPVVVPASSTPEEVEEIRVRFEQTLHEIEREAEILVRAR